MENKDNKYKIINNFLNDYARSVDGSFFLLNLPDIYLITRRMHDIIFGAWYALSNINFNNNKNTIDLSGLESIELTRNFIKEKCPIYLEKFETFLNNGCFDFVDIEDESVCDKKSVSGFLKEGHHREIKVVLEHNFRDPSTIIHEFFHQMNLDLSKGYRETRMLLTEGISIYFETLLFNFMEEKGYDVQEINRLRTFRIKDCYAICNDLLTETLLLDSYLKFGNINENTYKEREKYELYNWENEKYFDAETDWFLGFIEKKQSNPNVSYRYILGTLIAFHSINSSDQNMTDKFIKLNDKVNNKHLFECLKPIGIDMENDEEVNEKLIISFKKELAKISNSLLGINQNKENSVVTY